MSGDILDGIFSQQVVLFGLSADVFLYLPVCPAVRLAMAERSSVLWTMSAC